MEYLLLETGDRILLETGDGVLLESSGAGGSSTVPVLLYHLQEQGIS